MNDIFPDETPQVPLKDLFFGFYYEDEQEFGEAKPTKKERDAQQEPECSGQGYL